MATKKVTVKDAVKDAVHSVFAMAPVVEAPKKKAAEVEYEVVELGEELDHLVACRIATATIKPVSENLEAIIKENMFDHFLSVLDKTGKKPEAVICKHGDSSVMVQFRQKRSASISAEVADRMQKNGVEVIRTEKNGGWYIDPKVMDDSEQMGRVAVALAGLGIVGVVIHAEPTVSWAVAPGTFDSLADVKNAVERAELLRAVSEMSIGQVKIGGEDSKSESASLKAFAHLAKSGIIAVMRALMTKKKSA